MSPAVARPTCRDDVLSRIAATLTACNKVLGCAPLVSRVFGWRHETVAVPAPARTALGLSRSEFAGRSRVQVGTLRDWEQARISPPDFAVAYVKGIGKYLEMVAKAVV